VAAGVRGQPVPVDERRDLRLATTHAVQASVKVVDAMYTLAGGSSVYESSRLQRQFRDVHVATQHVMVAPSTWRRVGRLYLAWRRVRRCCEPGAFVRSRTSQAPFEQLL